MPGLAVVEIHVDPGDPVIKHQPLAPSACKFWADASALCHNRKSDAGTLM
jgi:hypothetical protein